MFEPEGRGARPDVMEYEVEEFLGEIEEGWRHGGSDSVMLQCSILLMCSEVKEKGTRLRRLSEATRLWLT